MRFLLRHCLCALMLLIVADQSGAQPEMFSQTWRWSRFTTESGLPSNNIFQCHEAADGTLWASTPAGISWFDGFQWIVVDSIHRVIAGNLSNELVCHTIDGKLSLISRSGVRHLLDGVSISAPLWGDSILYIKANRLFAFKASDPRAPHREVFAQRRASSLFTTSSGAAWVAVDDGLYVIRRGSIERILESAGEFPTFSGAGITNVLSENTNGSGLIFIIAPGEQRGIWEWKDRSLHTKVTSERLDFVNTLDVGPDDDALVVYRPNGLRYRHRGEWTSVSIDALGIEDIQNVKFLANGDLMIGASNGLFFCRRSGDRWKSLVHPEPDFRNSVNELLLARDGTLWSGTSRGIESSSPDGTTRSVSTIDGVYLETVTGLAEDRDGNIWCSSGASFSGAFRWDGRRWQRYYMTNNSDDINVHKIRPDREGRLWFLGMRSGTPPFLNDQPGAFVLENGVFIRWSIEEGLLNGRVYAFAQGRDGALWFGTWGGLSRRKDGAWKYWTRENGLESGRAFALAVDSSDRVWFSGLVNNNGVGYIDASDSIRYLSRGDNAYPGSVWDLRADPDGNVWAASDAGLFCINGDRLTRYDNRSGLQYNSLWPVLPTREMVYVGTRGKGIAILDRSVPIPPPPRVGVGDIVVDEHNAILRVSPRSFFGELPPSEIPTRFSVDGSSWSAWEKRTTINFSDLNSGEHEVRIQAVGLFAQYDTIGASARFNVQPPVALRPWVFIPGSAALIGLLTLTLLFIARQRSHKRQLRATEAKFRSAATTTSAAMFIEQNGKLVFVNPAALRISGYSEEAILGTSIVHLLSPNDRSMFLSFTGSLGAETNASQRMELRFVKPGREPVWLDCTIGRIAYEGGSAILGTAIDITERKQSEAALRESEMRYRIITELMFDYAYLDRFEEDGTMTIVWITESATRLTGYTIEEWKRPELMATFIHPDDVPNLLRGIQEVMKGNTYEIEGRVITRDGRTLWMYNYAAPIWNADHTRVTHMYGIARNITERKEAELRLALSEERYRSVAETAPDAIVITDGSGTIHYVNRAVESIFGFNRNELEGLHIGRLIHEFPGFRNRPSCDDEPGGIGVASSVKEIRGIHRDGRDIPLEMSLGEFSQDGHRFITGIIRDITDRKKVEAKLYSLASELSNAEDRERKRMASYVHDVISQGIALARIKVRLLLRSPLGAQAEAELVEIQKLLDQSITDTRTLTFELYPIVLYEHSFEAAVAWLGEKMESQHGITYTLEDDGLPKPLSVEVRNTLFQSTRECLVNIIKHAQASTVHITITRSNSRLCLEIADNGKGIKAARLPALMSEGGFGLYSIRERLTGMGGTFEISTEEGKGMRVRMSAGLSE